MNISPGIIVSSCLIGKNCSYDGKNRYSEAVKALCEKYGYIDVCPEVLGGLPIPREAHEIADGSGEDVLSGKCKVISFSGEDVSPYFLRGAELSLIKALENGVFVAIMKARSPSCGRGRVYAGSFDRELRDGNGVTAALFIKNGIPVFTEDESLEAEEELTRRSRRPGREN